jgi:hypothetical protein
MISLGFQSVTATALSLWLGVLACILGCARPAAASTPLPEGHVSGLIAASCPDPAGGEAGEPCCRHGHKPANGPGKSEHHSISCCPSETALIQKQNVVPPVSGYLYLAVLMLRTFHSSSFVRANANASSSTPWDSGRDILLQVHVLRI